jgi:hypothetical protein
MRRRLRPFFGRAFLLIGVLFGAAPFGDGCCARAASAELPIDQISALPFHLKNGFILIDGQVNGTRGVFILDTGMPFRVLLNRHFVPLRNGVDVKHGTVASGQAMIIESHSGEY